MKKYDIIKIKEPSICCISANGPIFGDHDFYLKKDMKTGGTYGNTNCNFLSNNNLELTGGKGNNETFEVDEFEVFKVIY